jgi:hypothetical protein
MSRNDEVGRATEQRLSVVAVVVKRNGTNNGNSRQNWENASFQKMGRRFNESFPDTKHVHHLS